jgi:hypothetical protein
VLSDLQQVMSLRPEVKNIWTAEEEVKESHQMDKGKLEFEDTEDVNELKEMVRELRQKNSNLEARNAELELGPDSQRVPNANVVRDFPPSVANYGPQEKEQGALPIGYPDFKQSKLNIERFGGEEVYPGLGSSFQDWGESFVRQMVFAQTMCRFNWPEDIKIEIFRNKLKGVALQQFNTHWLLWIQEERSLLAVMNGMGKIFVKEINQQQGMELMKKPKTRDRDWHQHYMYLIAVGKAMGGDNSKLILESLVFDACPEMATTLFGKYDNRRLDYVNHALEITEHATKLAGSKAVNQHAKKSNVNHVKGKSEKSCYACGKSGHIARDCYSKKTSDKVNHAEMVLCVDRVEEVTAAVRGTAMKTKQRAKGQKTCFYCGKKGHVVKDCDLKKSNDKTNRFEMVLTVEEVNEVSSLGSLKPEDGVWILDSGSSMHFVAAKRELVNTSKVSRGCVMANNTTVEVEVVGDVVMHTSEGVNLRVQDVHYHPRMSKNILSLGKLEERGCTVKYLNGKRYLVSRDGKKLFEIHLAGSIYYVKTKRVEECNNASGRNDDEDWVLALHRATQKKDEYLMEGTLMEFHQRLGHLSFERILKMADDPRSGLKITDKTERTCVACAEGKQTKNRQSKKDSGENAPTDRPGGVICGDIKGPMTPVDRSGNRYFVCFVDFMSNYTRVFLGKNKNHAADRFGHFLAYFERSFNCKIQVFRTDGGAEFKAMDLLCRDLGIQRQKAEPYNQASNGKAERMIRNIMEVARTMLLGSNLTTVFWGDAVLYACYVLNRMPTRANRGKKSPYEILTEKIPYVGDLVPFGAKCTVLVSHKTSGKKEPWKPRALEGRILGKNEEMKGYRVFIVNKKEVVTSQHVKNIEGLTESQNDIIKKIMDKENESQGVDEETKDGEEERDSTSEGGRQASFQPVLPDAKAIEVVQKAMDQAKKAKSKEKNALMAPAATATTKGVVTRSKSKGKTGMVNLVEHKDPKNYREAKKSSQWPQWKESMVLEWEALSKLCTWILTKRESNMKALHSKWVYKTKTTADGNIERFKARLVACGNEQIKGVNYENTFAPVLAMPTANTVCSLGIKWDVPPQHGDVPNAYPRAYTENGMKIYMEIPQGIVIDEETLKRLVWKTKTNY